MWAYLSAESGVMVLLAYWWPTPCSTYGNSSEMVVVSLGSPCAPSIYVVAAMYAFCPWEGKVYFLILFLQSFLLLSFLQFCYWFPLNSRETIGASTNKISVTGRLHSGTFVESSLVYQSCLEVRRSLTSGGLFLQLIDEAPSLCNVL